MQDQIPTFPVEGPGNTAGTCHGMMHRNGGRIDIDPIGEDDWDFYLDERAAAIVNARRESMGLMLVGTVIHWREP